MELIEAELERVNGLKGPRDGRVAAARELLMGSVSQKATEKSLGFVVGPGRPEFCVELRRLLELWGLSRFRRRPTDGARRAAMADGQIGGDGQGTAFCSGLGEFMSSWISLHVSLC